MRALLYVAFGTAVLFFPWWVFVPLGILVATLPYGTAVAVFGGILIDVTYGAPVAALGGFQYVYTAVFVLAAIVVLALSSRIVE